MKKQVRIETLFSACGTKVLNENGAPLVSHISNVEFRHKVGEVPQMVIERFATDVVLEGEVEVEVVTLCPCCKKQLEEEAKQPRTQLAVAETTAMGDEYKQFIIAPTAFTQ